MASAVCAVLAAVLAAAQAAAVPPLVELSTEPLGASCVPHPDLLRGAAAVASTPSGMAVFQAGARPGSWSGVFTRSALTVDASGVPQISAPLWDAAALLDALPEPARSRRIYTSRLEQGRRMTIPFEWDALSAAQRTILNRAPPPARPVSDRKGELRLDWLRGDRSEEGRLFRRRASILGDAVNSIPVYAGPPSAAGNGDGYRAFYDSMQARAAVVYLGANDGMLHAFDAGGGAELFAYVPEAVFPQLNRLPDRNYAHGAYVDGPASVAEAQLDGNWRTVLVSAMGAGAQGVFALDVTNPSVFPQAGGVLWEFTDRDDAAMGNVTSLPQIVRLRLRSAANAYRYFALVSSGVNSQASDGNADPANAGALFLLALDKPAGEAWRLNRNYYRLQAPAGETGRAYALGAPALVLDGDGALLYAYAGDLQGNLWRFNFTGSAPWRDAAEGPVFIARDARRVRQPITMQPRVANAPDGGYLILFGTGKLLETADRDPARYAQQSFYAVLDDSAGGRGGTRADWPLGRDDLALREVEGAPDAAVLALRGRSFTYGGAGGAHGWYIDFNGAATGERSVGGAALAGGQIFFNTVLTGASACAPVASRSYALDVLSGLAPDSAGVPLSGEAAGTLVADYLPGPAAVIVTEPAQAVRQAGGRMLVSKRIAAVNAGAREAGALPSARTKAVVPAGRLGWRELANWRELHQAAQARTPQPREGEQP
jgi:type IV pilus assembly protein PilY1